MTNKRMENSDLYSRPLIFNVYKPEGMSSFDVIRHFKKNLPTGYGKIGHFGTLDPFASGILLIGITGATRLTNYIHDLLPKTYLAQGKFGEQMSTGDYTGEVVLTDESFHSFKFEEINQKISTQFLGEYWQRPPFFSATKFQGKPLYEYAREGIQIEKDAVKREILSLECLELNNETFKFRAKVSSGTYIRTLFEDMALSLGTCGHLTGLKREAIGHISLETSMRSENWPKKGEPFDFGVALSFDQALPLNDLILAENLAKKVRNGNEISFDSALVHSKTQAVDKELFWAKDETGKLIGLVKKLQNADGQILKVEFNLPS